ncbi:coiled-coil domain-containing protein 174-like [Dendronephthya gigantea]|uniref:coiled-coil domain-containing protein 174-like n=1 Tax=Dendronephthya gigantea TaxID=151771 RepID=UPI00106BAB11|nr:coiled-coil domain-containing protein 174-like [Dendronephthya gigantea]
MAGKKIKIISVNESSLVDLKAELYRKETQLKRNKVDGNQPKKAPIWQKKKESKVKTRNTGSETKSLKDKSYDKELEKSRLMLEAKSALYDKLSNGEIEVPSDEDEQDGRFLVDFHKKSLPKNVDEVDKSNIDNPEDTPVATSPDKEWVEYVDSFGRSKMCLRKDLPLMKEKDENVKLKSLEESKLTLLSDDMRRDMIRKKWEEEVQEALDKPVGPVHYQDMMFGETRQHGVGYYKFSKVEEERQEQQTALNKLRAQTEQQRNKREKLLEKRKAAMDARLAKIRARKQQKLHEAGAVEDTQEEEEKTDEITIEDTEEEKEENEVMIGAMVERIRNKTTKFDNKNEWEKKKVDLERFDKPKKKTPSYDPRSERNPEFAPPSFYEKTSETPKKFSETKWEGGNQGVEEETQNVSVSQDRTSGFIQHQYTLNNQETSEDDHNTNSSQYSNIATQNYQPIFSNTNPYVQNTNFIPPNTHPNLHTTFPNLPPPPFPNLPPPPSHTFPPPNIPPPFFPPPVQIPPQYPIPYLPPSIPKNQQYPNVPQKPVSPKMCILYKETK